VFFVIVNRHVTGLGLHNPRWHYKQSATAMLAKPGSPR
jgi:hypothetical protein